MNILGYPYAGAYLHCYQFPNIPGIKPWISSLDFRGAINREPQNFQVIYELAKKQKEMPHLKKHEINITHYLK